MAPIGGPSSLCSPLWSKPQARRLSREMTDCMAIEFQGFVCDEDSQHLAASIRHYSVVSLQQVGITIGRGSPDEAVLRHAREARLPATRRRRGISQVCPQLGTSLAQRFFSYSDEPVLNAL
jgi:hypothetical protein